MASAFRGAFQIDIGAHGEINLGTGKQLFFAMTIRYRVGI